MMMWFFLVSDALLFAGFLSAYAFVRLAAPSTLKTIEMLLIDGPLWAVAPVAALAAAQTGARRRPRRRRGRRPFVRAKSRQRA